jgi:hypothetical protein
VLNITDILPYHTMKMQCSKNSAFLENFTQNTILWKNKKCPIVYKIRIEMVMTRKSEHNINKISSNVVVKKE